MERFRSELARLQLENKEFKLAALGSSHTTAHRDRLYTKEIPEWNGGVVKPGDAELFLERFDRVANRYGWTDADRREVLLSKLTGAAERYLRIHNRDFMDAQDWEAVKEIFLKRFSRKRDLLADMRALLKLKREPGEDYRTYADRCEEAGVLAFTIDDIGNEAERKGARAVMDRVVLGMFQLGTETPVRRYLKGQDISTLEDAVRLPERVSAEYDAETNRAVNTVVREGYSFDEHEVAQEEENFVRAVRFRGTSARGNSGRDRYSPKTPCPRCSQYGHWLKDCPTWKKCRVCGAEGHLMEKCEQTKCFRCGEFGHVRRVCQKYLVEEPMEGDRGPNTWTSGRNRSEQGREGNRKDLNRTATELTPPPR